MPSILSALPGGSGAGALFSPAPRHPKINDPVPQTTLPLPLPKKKQRHPRQTVPENAPAALKTTHNCSSYYKPLPKNSQNSPDGAVISADEVTGRSVVVGESGLSYRLPGSSFEFQFSYSEVPKVKPLALREPAFLPFAPPTMQRPWTGKAPLLSKKQKDEKRKKIRLAGPLGSKEGEMTMEMNGGKRAVENMTDVYGVNLDGRSREEVLGEPLTKAEVRVLVKRHMSSNRQVNLGRDGLTHNMLNLIHSHWRRDEVCKVRCRGVPTVDMRNICCHLEERTAGKIICRVGGIVYLFRGRNYDHRTRPRYPIMLWKPAAPVYPKLIQETPGGLTKEEADEFRSKGKNLLPICKLAKNGIYITLVKDVRDAFEGSPLVKINCQGMHASDYKKLGAKLKELVPCVLLSFDDEQILMWRGKDWRPRYGSTIPSSSQLHFTNNHPSCIEDSGQLKPSNGEAINRKQLPNPKMQTLWKRALESQKALLLDEIELTPDSLLERVEEFGRISQAAEHSYPALIVPSSTGDDSDSSTNEESNIENEADAGREDQEKDREDFSEEIDDSVPLGGLPVDDLIAKHLGGVGRMRMEQSHGFGYATVTSQELLAYRIISLALSKGTDVSKLQQTKHIERYTNWILTERKTQDIGF